MLGVFCCELASARGRRKHLVCLMDPRRAVEPQLLFGVHIKHPQAGRWPLLAPSHSNAPLSGLRRFSLVAKERLRLTSFIARGRIVCGVGVTRAGQKSLMCALRGRPPPSPQSSGARNGRVWRQELAPTRADYNSLCHTSMIVAFVHTRAHRSPLTQSDTRTQPGPSWP